MDDLRTIIQDHRSKSKSVSKDDPKTEQLGVENAQAQTELPYASSSEIPDIFFDEILLAFKLNRVEIMVMMYLYRRVWCRANLYKEYGISQILSHTEMSKTLNVEIEQIYQALRKIEEYGFISTIRSGQYFVRKYFTKENDEIFGQNYNDFEN